MKKLIAFAALIYLYLFQTEHGTKFLEQVINKTKQPFDEVNESKEKMEERNEQVAEDADEVLE